MNPAAFAVLAALALVARFQPALAQDQRPGAPEIHTTGAGEVTLPPDRAVLQIGVATRAAGAAEASSQNATRLRAVADALVGLGFPRDSIRRIAYTVGPQWDFEGNRRRPSGYAARSTLQLTVGDLARLGAVIDAALGAGATDLPSIAFESDSADAARATALAKALQAARRDAEALARAAGGRLGALRAVSTSPQAFSPAARGYALEAVTVTAAAPPLVRDVVVRVSVQARWEFQPGPEQR